MNELWLLLRAMIRYIYILLKCYHRLNSMAKFQGDMTNQGIDEDYNMDIFQQIASIRKSTKELASNC